MIKVSWSSQLARNAISGPLVALVNLAVLALAYPIYLHHLGYELYGVWLVLTAVLSAAQLGNLGVSTAVTKLVAQEHGRGDTEAIQQYTSNATLVLLASGVAILTLTCVFRVPLVALFRMSTDPARQVLSLLPFVACLSAYVLVVQAVNATLSGLGRMDLANYIRAGSRVLGVAVAACLLHCGRGIESLLIGDIVMYGLIHILSLLGIRHVDHVRFFRFRYIDLACCRRLLHFGGGVAGGSLMDMLLSPFNKVMLARYAGLAAIPVYEIAFRGSMQVRTFLETGFRALLPEIGRTTGERNGNVRARVLRMNRQAHTLIGLVGLPIYGVIFVLAGLLLKMWLGDAYVADLPHALRTLLVATFISLIGVPSYYTLLGLGIVRHAFLAHVILSGLSAVLVLSALLLFHTVTVEIVCRALVASTVASTAYLWWQRGRAVSAL